MASKRYKEAYKKTDPSKKYLLDEALKYVLESCTAKFDETIEACVRLGVDPKQSDQQVRGAVKLPHGLGREVKVLVFAKGEKEEEAKKAGADYVGDEYIEKIKKGWLDFDRVISTPDMMSVVSQVAKVLGPKGLMPNLKVGTVTNNITQAVQDEKKGKLAYRVEKAGIVHGVIGKKSMGEEKLKENYLSFLASLMKKKPSSSKGIYLKGITLSGTMGSGVNLDIANSQSLL